MNTIKIQENKSKHRATPHLEGVVEGEPEQEEVGEVLGERERGKGDPVDEPLRVVILGAALNGLEGPERRVHHTHHRRNQAHTINQQRQQHDGRGQACELKTPGWRWFFFLHTRKINKKPTEGEVRALDARGLFSLGHVRGNRAVHLVQDSVQLVYNGCNMVHGSQSRWQIF
jgi:hypothetical protein